MRISVHPVRSRLPVMSVKQELMRLLGAMTTFIMVYAIAIA